VPDAAGHCLAAKLHAMVRSIRIDIPVAVQGTIDADDVRQEAWLSIGRSLPLLESLADDDLKRWLRRDVRWARGHLLRAVAARTAPTDPGDTERAASLAGGVAVELTYVPAPGSPPDQACAERELHAFIRDQIDALPTRQRRAVCLRYWDDLTLAQIAQRLESTVPKVDHLLRNARQALAQASSTSPPLQVKKSHDGRDADAAPSGRNQPCT